MIQSLITFLEQTIIPLGAGGIFLASVIEEIIAPIPSALVMTMSGFLFVSGPVSAVNISKIIFVVAVPAAIGVTLGSLAVYGAAWWGGRRVLEKWGKFLGLYWRDVEKLESKLKDSKKDEIAVIGARVIPIVPSVAISAFCGFIRMPIIKYAWITFIGMLVRAIIIATIGWQVGNVYYRFGDFINRIEKLFLALIALAVCLFILFFIIKKRKSALPQ